jgi:hypothetical protein
VPAGYIGDWIGSTAQGTLMQVNVSADDHVTTFTIAYKFAATCSGTLTYTNLAVPIHRLDPLALRRSISLDSGSARRVRTQRVGR